MVERKSIIEASLPGEKIKYYESFTVVTALN